MLYIVLIHGTRAKNAPWTRQGSPLRHWLQNYFSGDLEFLAYQWSGKNNFHSRAVASDELVNLLRKLILSDSTAKFFMVAHSHGGNVALQIGKYQDISERIVGLVCLATPVLIAREVKSDIEPPQNIINTAISALIGHYATGELIGWAFVLTALAINIFLMLTNSLIKRCSFRWADVIRGHTEKPFFDQDKVLFVRHQGDEASAVLAIAYAVNRSLIYTSKALGWPGKAWGSSGTFKIIIFAWCVAIASSLSSNSKFAIFFAFTSYVIVAGIFWTLIAFVCLRALSQVILAFAFGFEVSVRNASLRITAEPSPLGAWQVLMLIPEDIEKQYPYAHGIVYSHPEFFSAISDWMMTRRGLPIRSSIKDWV